MRKSKYYVLAVLILAILVAVLVVKIPLPSRLFRKAVLNPIPASVKNIRASRYVPILSNEHKYVLRFNISKEDLSLILRSRRFKKISSVEYNDGLLSYENVQNVRSSFFLYDTYRGKSAPWWFRLGEWKNFKAYVEGRIESGFESVHILLYNEGQGEAYFIDYEVRDTGVGLVLTYEEYQRKLEEERYVSPSFKKELDGVTITISDVNVTGETLELCYQIKNDSKQDIWICKAIDSSQGFDAFLEDDLQTVKVRIRHDVPRYVASPRSHRGHYVRLRPGYDRTELLSLPLPVQSPWVYGDATVQDLAYAKCLALEISFYSSDLPGVVCALDEKAKKLIDKNFQKDSDLFRFGTAGFFNFYTLNESVMLRSRDEEIFMIPYTYQVFKEEKVLRIAVDGLNIPYSLKIEPTKILPPDIKDCTRLEIQYQPSMLEYFFPYASQQNLLSQAERQHLRSQKTIEVSDPEHLKAFAKEISKGNPGGIIAEGSTAKVVCYRDDERLTSFTIYNDASIETEEKRIFMYKRGISSLNVLTPQIQPFQSRIHCVNNLKNLWYRLRLYHLAKYINFVVMQRKTEIEYKIPEEWCDALLLKGYYNIVNVGMNTRLYKCPAADKGKCPYAINPNCEPNSPPDMVLLFETKAGWNQHGGPELFTFDNHNPRGGCVLLNDGTVKFIRTEKELNQLRWK
jgi:hypothetical protein